MSMMLSILEQPHPAPAFAVVQLLFAEWAEWAAQRQPREQSGETDSANAGGTSESDLGARWRRSSRAGGAPQAAGPPEARALATWGRQVIGKRSFTHPGAVTGAAAKRPRSGARGGAPSVAPSQARLTQLLLKRLPCLCKRNQKTACHARFTEEAVSYSAKETNTSARYAEYRGSHCNARQMPRDRTGFAPVCGDAQSLGNPVTGTHATRALSRHSARGGLGF